MRIGLTIPDQGQEPPDLKGTEVEIGLIADSIKLLANPL